MFSLPSILLGWLLVGSYALAWDHFGSTMNTAPAGPVPESLSRHAPRQVTRDDVIRRAAARSRIHGKKQALQPRQSAIVYPTCSSLGIDAIPSSGFAQFPGYYVGRSDSTYDMSGSIGRVTSDIACAQLCQENTACTGFYWDAGKHTCSFRQRSPSGRQFVSETRNLGVMALAGDCASLSKQINNATIMASCCNNAPPSSRNVCIPKVYKGFDGWSVTGQRKLGSANAITGVGGRVIVSSYKACLDACEAYTNRNYPYNGLGCTGVVYDGYRLTDGINTCLLYGSNPTANIVVTDTVYVLFTKGTCAQNRANGIDVGSPCCDST